MKIQYYLIENLMTPDPDDCRAQVTGYEVVTEKELIEFVTRKGSGVTTAEAKGNYEEFIGALDYFLKQGFGITTEFIIIQPVIQGVFINKDDKFDPHRHTIRYRSRLGKRYNRVTEDVKTEKHEIPVLTPLPLSLEDISSTTVNDTITPGGTAILHGQRLKFNQDDPQQGIFFVIPEREEEFRVNRILSHNASQVVFLIPSNMPSNTYVLELRMLRPGNRHIQKGQLPDKLNV
jgi:hypothetical protein